MCLIEIYFYFLKIISHAMFFVGWKNSMEVLMISIQNERKYINIIIVNKNKQFNCSREPRGHESLLLFLFFLVFDCFNMLQSTICRLKNYDSKNIQQRDVVFWTLSSVN